jgi:hypothetical protein
VGLGVLARDSLPTISRMRTLIGIGSLVALASLGLAACSDSGGDGSTVTDGTAGNGTAANGSGASSNGGSINGTAGSLELGGNMSSGGTQGTGEGGDGSGTGGGASCASASAEATLAPVYLVFLLDESGSMGDGEHGKRAEKWDPVTAALNAFFEDEASAGITASLGLFPLDKNKTTGVADSKIGVDCDASAYGAPEVAPTALPNATLFKAALDKLAPPNEWGTPTFPAIVGTLDYAESLLAEDSARKVAVVMVTDGDPTQCTSKDADKNNNITNTAKAAAAKADHIPTYVIGVGKSLKSLDAIALGGGTEKAFIVSADDPLQTPEQTQTQLLEAINQIRGNSISCELPMPSPPAGKKLDPNKVNVHFAGQGKPDTSLEYGTECTGSAAWHYDDAAKPTKILLCDDTCKSVKADPMGKLSVEFACKDRVVVQ